MRAPIYSKKDPKFRVISGPNGIWIFQCLGTRPPDALSCRVDPWMTLMCSSDKDEAIRRLPV